MTNKELELLVDAVLKSPKYRNVCVDLIRNIGRRELSKRRNLREAIKATKNKLHQIGGAYFLTEPRYDIWLSKLRRASERRNEELRKACAEIMGCHQSTKERLRVLDELYETIFSIIPRVNSVMDIACGLHPLSIPWMHLPSRVEYYASDVYIDLIEFLNSYFTLVDVEGYAEVRDVVQDPPEVKADLAFVLNTVPCLEQIEKFAGLKVLESTDADYLVVSFPVRSLGGRKKGMQEFYEGEFNRFAHDKEWSFQRLALGTELVFVVEK